MKNIKKYYNIGDSVEFISHYDIQRRSIICVPSQEFI